MASALYNAIQNLGQSVVSGMTAKQIEAAVMPVASNAGMISRELAKLGWTAKTARGQGAVKTENGNKDKTDASHFNGYSNNLSDAFRRAYQSYKDVNSDAPALADIYSQVTSEVKTYISGIAENVLFNAMLKASNCKEPSRDFELLGIETSAMKQAKAESLAKVAADNAALVAKLESAGYIVFKAHETPTFQLADMAINNKVAFDADIAKSQELIASVAKVKTAIKATSDKLDKATQVDSKATLSAKLNELNAELTKLESQVATDGKSLVSLAKLIKGEAEKAQSRHDAIVALVDGLVEGSDKATKLAIEAAQSAHDAVNAIVPTVQAQSPKSISLEEQRAINLVKQGFCTDIDKARAMVKAMDSGLTAT